MKSFNYKQQQVINELDNNIVVLASAGTGKTGTLAQRVVNILENDRAQATEILCISFTNKACKEMKHRIEEAVGAKSKEITVKTFHSWCFDMIKKQAKKQTDLFTDFIVYDEEDCKQVILESKRLLADFQNQIFKVDILQQFINLVKEEIARVKTKGNGNQAVEEVIKDIYCTKMEKIDHICRGLAKEEQWQIKKALRNKGEALVHTYNLLLRENRGVDFADLILSTLDIFKDDATVESLQNTYKYINIDEVQDTSVVEYYIIEKIFGKNKILLCGDIFQTIYEWRGSAPESILKEFKESYKPEEIIFNTNYRATKNLVNLSVEYLNKAFPKKAKTPKTFDFLGFTHYCSERVNGNYRVKRKTDNKKFSASLIRFKEWLRLNMHTPLKILIEKLNRKLMGYYRYYGITDNIYALKRYRDAVQRQLFWVLNRRSQTGSYSWETYNQMKKSYPIVRPKIYVNMFELRPRN